MPDIDIEITVSEDTNVTIQRLTEVIPIMDPNNSDFIGYGLFIDITLEDQDALDVLTISFSVAEMWDMIEAQGLTLYDIDVYYFDEILNEWIPANSTSRDLVYKIVIGTFDHTTTIGALGKTRESGPGGNFVFFLFLVVAVVGSVSAAALLVYDHQMNTQAGNISYLSMIETVMKNLYSDARKRFGTDD